MTDENKLLIAFERQAARIAELEAALKPFAMAKYSRNITQSDQICGVVVMIDELEYAKSVFQRAEKRH